MNRIIGHILLFAFISTGTDFDQVARLPVLFSHYHEHQQQDPDISISAFLQIHFFDPALMDHDHERDLQLPYKNHDSSHHTDYLKIFYRKSFAGPFDHALFSGNLSVIPSEDQLPPHCFFTDIWNPPKA
ncbi:MAG: hypothetical protein JNL88_01400 [Bacteroidia bacterium]|nr:hypothetical protein [Bacteroidia bacterium]